MPVPGPKALSNRAARCLPQGKRGPPISDAKERAARGTGATPCYAPRLTHPHDGELWGGRPWDDVALFQAPAVWVSDPADPAGARAGANPLVVRAIGALGCDLVLGDDDRVRYRTAMSGSRVPGEGTVAVVIDP